MPEIHKGIGITRETLPGLVGTAQNILLVSGKGSYEKTSIQEIIEGSLAGKNITRVYDFEANPKISDLVRIITEEIKTRFDAVITIGGGSVMDMGKLIYFFQGKNEEFITEYLQGKHPEYSGAMNTPLISIPTTAGTGSESTHFAVLYDRHATKHSVAHASLLPSQVILDAQMLESINLDVLGPTILDSLCQCIESYWSIHATPESKKDTRKGLEILKQSLEGITPTSVLSLEKKQALLEAANYSGRGINISKTTASHAVSYPITSKYGIPHGHAVALTIGQMLKFNSEATPESELNGDIYLKDLQKMMSDILDIFGCNTADDFIKYIQTVMAQLGLKYSLSELRIDDIEYIIKNGFNPQRVVNNPRKLDEDSLRNILINLR